MQSSIDKIVRTKPSFKDSDEADRRAAKMAKKLRKQRRMSKRMGGLV